MISFFQKIYPGLREDVLLKRVVRNSSYLFSSNTISAALSVVQGILVTGLVGDAGYGLLAIVMDFASNTNRLLSFRMSEIVVKYVGEALAQDDRERAAALVKEAKSTGKTIRQLLSKDWLQVQSEVSRFSKVFSYDRAGLGRSETAPIPRTCKDMIGDLRNLLVAARLHPPYILVAHSWSGINARWYANQYPHEIVGMVLNDAVNENKYELLAKACSEEEANRMWASIKDPAQNGENIDRIASIEQVHSKQTIYNFPLIVLTRAANTDEKSRIETSLQAEFLKLSTKSRQYFSKFNDHSIHISEPELVIDSIRQVVESVKAKGV